MQDYLTKCLIYFVILAAIAFFEALLHGKDLKERSVGKIMLTIRNLAIVSFIPLVRGFIAVIMVVYSFIPNELLKESEKRKDSKRNG